MLCGGHVSANDEFTPIANPAVTGPNFLAVHDVVITVETRFHLQSGEIGTGVRLGKALAPDFFSAQNLRNIPLSLCLGPTRDDGGYDPDPNPAS